MIRTNKCYRFVELVGTVILLMALAACAAPAPTPTPTTKPATAATPTKAPAATPTATKVAIRFEGGKFQPLPDGYPNKPITFYAGKTGSGTDIFIRQLINAAQPLSPIPLVIKNAGGGPETYFTAARGDDRTGYAISAMPGSFVPINYVGGHNFGLGKDYVLVAVLNTTDSVFMVKADAPWKIMKDFLDYAKANPGLRLATSVPGTTHHVVCEWIAKEAGVKWTCIPHESSGDAVRSVLAGDLVAAQLALSTVQPQADAGKVRVLGTAGSDKLAKHPDAVRFTDLGYKIRFDDFYGVMAPAETSELRVQWLSALLVKATENAEYRKWTDSIGQRIMAYPADKATAMLMELDPVINRLTKELGMQP